MTNCMVYAFIRNCEYLKSQGHFTNSTVQGLSENKKVAKMTCSRVQLGWLKSGQLGWGQKDRAEQSWEGGQELEERGQELEEWD